MGGQSTTLKDGCRCPAMQDDGEISLGIAYCDAFCGEQALDFESAARLEACLRSAGVPVDMYGQGGAKRVADLLREIQRGSSRLERADGKLTRAARACQITLVSELGILVETHKRLATGALRARLALLAGSICDGELVSAAVQRAVQARHNMCRARSCGGS